MVDTFLLFLLTGKCENAKISIMNNGFEEKIALLIYVLYIKFSNSSFLLVLGSIYKQPHLRIRLKFLVNFNVIFMYIFLVIKGLCISCPLKQSKNIF